jgi:hypothetical protein
MTSIHLHFHSLHCNGPEILGLQKLVVVVVDVLVLWLLLVLLLLLLLLVVVVVLLLGLSSSVFLLTSRAVLAKKLTHLRLLHQISYCFWNLFVANRKHGPKESLNNVANINENEHKRNGYEQERIQKKRCSSINTLFFNPSIHPYINRCTSIHTYIHPYIHTYTHRVVLSMLKRMAENSLISSAVNPTVTSASAARNSPRRCTLLSKRAFVLTEKTALST